MVEEKKVKVGLLVEDTTVVGGTDVETGAPVVRSRTVDGKADVVTAPTDLRESADKPAQGDSSGE